ncbi:MAG: hypothetical protein ACFFBD_27205, partial [Candidatus Hodarchaeota archaeon]
LDILGEEDRIDKANIVLLHTSDWKLVYQSSNQLYDDCFSPNDDYVLLMEYDSYRNYLLYGERINIIRTEDGKIVRQLNANFGGIFSIMESIVGVTEDYVLCSGIAYNTDAKNMVLKIWQNWHDFDSQDVIAPLLIWLAIFFFIAFLGSITGTVLAYIFSIYRNRPSTEKPDVL